MNDKAATITSSDDDTSDTESDISTDEVRYQCSAMGLCVHYRKGQKSSNWLKKDQKTLLCHICKHYAHDECMVKLFFSSDKHVREKH